jgi:hypothetical protein
MTEEGLRPAMTAFRHADETGRVVGDERGVARPLSAERAPPAETGARAPAPFQTEDEKKPRLHPRGGANPCQ